MESIEKSCLKSIINSILKKLCDDVPVGINSLEVVYGLIKVFRLDQKVLDAYISRWFSFCVELELENQTRKIRVISKFVTELIEKKLFDPASAVESWFHFCNQFSSYKCMKELHTLISQTLKTKASN